MNTLTPNSAVTFETLMASIHESNRFLTEKLAETDKLQKENAKQQKENERFLTEKFAETDRLQKETGKLQKENAKQQKEMKEGFAEMRRQFNETNEKWEKYEKRMKNMEKLTGSWSNNHGTFAEEYFYNAFLDGQQNFFGEKFDCIRNQVHSVTQKLEDEYDIVLYNHS